MSDTQPTIPAEAVEATARAAYDRVKVPSLPSWDEQTDGVREMWRDEVCLILAAALPHLAQHVRPSACCAATEQIYGHWLVEAHDHCTCGDGGPMGHEPGCGMTPLVDLAGLPGWDSTVEQVRRETLESAADDLEATALSPRYSREEFAAWLRARAAEAVDR